VLFPIPDLNMKPATKKTCAAGGLLENPEKFPSGFAGLPNLGISSRFSPGFGNPGEQFASNSGNFQFIHQTAMSESPLQGVIALRRMGS
jgi:hypothetical protein